MSSDSNQANYSPTWLRGWNLSVSKPCLECSANTSLTSCSNGGIRDTVISSLSKLHSQNLCSLVGSWSNSHRTVCPWVLSQELAYCNSMFISASTMLNTISKYSEIGSCFPYPLLLRSVALKESFSYNHCSILDNSKSQPETLHSSFIEEKGVTTTKQYIYLSW